MFQELSRHALLYQVTTPEQHPGRFYCSIVGFDLFQVQTVVY